MNKLITALGAFICIGGVLYLLVSPMGMSVMVLGAFLCYKGMYFEHKKEEVAMKRKSQTLFFDVDLIRRDILEQFKTSEESLNDSLLEAYEDGETIFKDVYSFQNVTVSGGKVYAGDVLIGYAKDPHDRSLSLEGKIRFNLSAEVGNYAKVVGDHLEYGYTKVPHVVLIVICE